MGLLEAIPVPPEAKAYVVGLMPIIALALALVITTLMSRPHAGS